MVTLLIMGKVTLLNEKKDLLIEQKEKENQYKLVRKSGYINIVVLLIVLLVIVIFLMGRWSKYFKKSYR